LADPGGGSKTLSAAGGGSIVWPCFSVTFADGSTTFRVGVQDVDLATGLEDGTFDVHGELTGGGGGIAVGLNNTAMTSGTKTIANGDLIAIVMEMPARAGADDVRPAVMNSPLLPLGSGTLFPYGTTDSGSGPSKAATHPAVTIIFDDGTLGWVPGRAATHAWWITAADINFGSGSTPDEYAAVFALPYAATIDAIGVGMSDVDAGDDIELILYSDPLGTPSAVLTVTIDPDVVRTGGGGTAIVWPYFTPITPTTLTAGATYAVAMRPTTANLSDWRYYDIASGLGSPPSFGSTRKYFPIRSPYGVRLLRTRIFPPSGVQS
jgi:hypothetical protein